MAEQDVVVNFGAQIGDLQSKFEQVGGLFKDLTEKFAVMAAIVGGGAAFKAFIDSANKVNDETVRLSKTLGITGDDAAALNTALGDIGSSGETYTSAFIKFNRQLRTNADGLKELGIDVDGVRNGTISSEEAFNQAIRTVGTYKAGIDQTQVAMKLFGRNVADVQTLMKLTPAIIEEARKTNEELNLNISKESVEASRKYKIAIHEVDDVLTGLEKTVGEAVIPLFTASAQKLRAIGPTLVEGMKAAADVFVDIYGTIQEVVSDVIGVVSDILASFRDLFADVFDTHATSAMEVFKNVLALVHIAFIAFRIGFEEVVNAVKTGLQLLGEGLGSFGAFAVATWRLVADAFMDFGKVADRALHLDFEGAKAAWDEATSHAKKNATAATEVIGTAAAERQRIQEEGIAKAVEIAKRGADDIEKAALKPLDTTKKKTTPYEPPSGDKKADIGKKNSAIFEAERALLKAQTEAELAIQREYLKEAQQIYDEAYANGLITTKEYYAAKLAVSMQTTDAEIAAKRKELTDTEKLEGDAKKPEQKLKFQAQEAQLTGQINVLLAQRQNIIRENAEQERKALQELADDAKLFQSNEQKSQGEGRVAQEKTALDQMKALRQIDAQSAFDVEKRIEDEAYAIAQKSIADRAALVKGSEIEQQKAREALQLESEAAERTHQDKLTQISNAADLERQHYAIQAEQGIETAFGGVISGILSGTQTLQNIFRNFATAVAGIFTNLIGQKFAEQIFNATGLNKAIGAAVNFVTDGIASMVKQFIGGEVAKTAAAQAGTTARQGLTAVEAFFGIGQKEAETGAAVIAEGTQAAAATTADTEKATSATVSSGVAIAAQQAETTAAVLGYASEAAVASMASVAAIPFVGWAMAPEVGAATYATGLAYLATAAGGWGEVPEDQIAQVHKKEMILPAHLAEGVRDMIDGTARKSDLPTGLPPSVARASSGSSAPPAAAPSSSTVTAAGGKAGDVHFHVQAIDAAGVSQFLMKHGNAIAKSLQNQRRNFVGINAA